MEVEKQKEMILGRAGCTVVLPMMHRAESENDKTPISASQTYPHTFYYRLKRSFLSN